MIKNDKNDKLLNFNNLSPFDLISIKTYHVNNSFFISC